MEVLSYVAGGLGLAAAGLFLLRQYRSYTKWGYFKCRRDLSGLVYVVTGGNAGLGLHAATQLAQAGAQVVLACRRRQAGQAAAEDIRRKTGNPAVTCLELDLADLASVAAFAENFREQFDKLDVLVCNAGVWVPPETEPMPKTEQGYEIHFGVNHLGHFVLTQLLAGCLKASAAGGRVVLVSSMLMNYGQLGEDGGERYIHEARPADASMKHVSYAPPAYCDSKLMNGVMARLLAERGLVGRAYACCPGFCYTDLGRHTKMSFWKKLAFLPIACIIMRSAARGSQNIVHAAAQDEEKMRNGAFYRECKVAEKETEKIKDLESQGAEMWLLSERLAQPYLKQD